MLLAAASLSQGCKQAVGLHFRTYDGENLLWPMPYYACSPWCGYCRICPAMLCRQIARRSFAFGTPARVLDCVKPCSLNHTPRSGPNIERPSTELSLYNILKTIPICCCLASLWAFDCDYAGSILGIAKPVQVDPTFSSVGRGFLLRPWMLLSQGLCSP